MRRSLNWVLHRNADENSWIQVMESPSIAVLIPVDNDASSVISFINKTICYCFNKNTETYNEGAS